MSGLGCEATEDQLMWMVIRLRSKGVGGKMCLEKFDRGKTGVKM